MDVSNQEVPNLWLNYKELLYDERKDDLGTNVVAGGCRKVG